MMTKIYEEDDVLVKSPVEPVYIQGVQIHPVTVEQLHNYIKEIIDMQLKALILHVNVYGLNLAYDRHWLKTFWNSCDLIFCDGAGVKLGAKLLGNHIPGRITYADWMWNLGDFSESNGYSIYLLGAKPGVAEKAAKSLRERFPNIQIAGFNHGYFDKSIGSGENQTVIQQINKVKPNILLTAFGMPLQEQWLKENWSKIDANIALTGGAVFDYISGDLQRAPKWMTDNGFEWLGRLLIEPRRLWKRYAIGNPLFFWRVIKQRVGMLDSE